MRPSDYLSSAILLSAIWIAQPVPAQVVPPVGQTMSAAEVNELQAKAQAGDALAQLKLGKAYGEGNGVPQSDARALKWYRAAAEQGNAAAQNDVGIMFRLGRGVDQDKKEAVEWFRKAAKQENANALFNLGTAYYNGDGVAIDDTAAYAWFLPDSDVISITPLPSLDLYNGLSFLPVQAYLFSGGRR
ncbi:MAG: tetratricopeptide repeat protein [Terriglobales bacterium]